MQTDPPSSSGDGDPLDALLSELSGLDDLEERFALLDARNPSNSEVDDDPFADIARALREYKESHDNDLQTPEGAPPPSDFEDYPSATADHADDFEDSADESVSVEIEELCHDALDALDIDDLSLAREIAMGAVRLDDEHPFPMFVLGLIAEREDDLDTARDMAELSLRTAATNGDAIGLRAHIHVRQHELSEASDLLRFGIAHNPDDASLHEALARVCLANGNYEEALKEARITLRIEPTNPGAMAVRTAALEESCDKGALLAALRQGVQLHPEDPYAMVELASIEMEHGNVDRARMLLVRAQRLAPRDRVIGDVRALIENVYERPLLRPVPALMRWIKDFPGGLAGFLVGFIIAALPLHALATFDTAYRIPAITIIATWGMIALYAWLAPAALSWRLNQRAAYAEASRLEDEFLDPLMDAPKIERVIEVLAMLALANERNRTAKLATTAAERLLPSIGTESTALLRSIAVNLQTRRARLRHVAMSIAVLPRLLVALGTTVILLSPSIAQQSGVSFFLVHGCAMALLLTAWLIVRWTNNARHDFEQALTAVRLASTQPRRPSAR